jgi:hypothetical protein
MIRVGDRIHIDGAPYIVLARRYSPEAAKRFLQAYRVASRHLAPGGDGMKYTHRGGRWLVLKLLDVYGLTPAPRAAGQLADEPILDPVGDAW